MFVILGKSTRLLLNDANLFISYWCYVTTILCKCYPVCSSQHSCLLRIHQRGTLSFTPHSTIIVHIPLASCFQRLKSLPIRSCLSQLQFLALAVCTIYFSGCWEEAPDNNKLMREDFVVTHSFCGTDHHQIREGTVAGGRCNNPQPGENCEWWCSTHFSISFSLLLPFPHTFLLQLEWNSTAYTEVGSSHLNLPIYIKDLTKTCFHMIQNPVKVPFKINHHKHITYLGVSKTPNLSLVLFLQLRMRLNKENN